jgi:NAD(P)-dependent dehydrogenase (short-subunit alcohol dehydrogenase family)
MDLGLADKVAVVTGAGAGIGLAVCRALAAEGMRVVGASRRDPEESARGVRVVSVSPGPTRTAMWLGPAGVARVVAGKEGITPEEVIAGAEGQIPLGRLAEPAEIAAVVAFLGSPRASYVSGVDLLVDGGLIPTL